MTGPADFELMDLTGVYALGAIDGHQRADIDRNLDAAPAAVANAFRDEVRAYRETMALVSDATAVEPPPELRERILAAVTAGPAAPRRSWRRPLIAAAAALVIGLGVLSTVVVLRPPSTPTAARVFEASDVQTTTAAIPTGGVATFVYSRDTNAGVLVMNNVAPPPPGSVYQMWLLDGGTPRSAGTMNGDAVRPSTTAVLTDLGNTNALAFTVEPGTGSPQPTGQIFAKLSLT
ncbi:anti-sigma-K factor RskA [Mycolicibacterium sp. BK556]|uniref:anti-sigma factor n=1 Tax=unclassified Mycolicibacterium TaxID=2636767 RepID=UPI0016124B36|nr:MULTISPECIES: anti-sigma factor [unclassified Mycolicibacterium]MBB3602628.1 anti-sigma-K factor RskA [Mycolicibacterium sp. BK556]MBB3632380.1 anti-sigma-K factor RskA [Mycolicibacterium sp. BK607]MBB3750415.1 anti-sigma-K factor RskA [Mycolicibacterium sp. BK634]